MSVISRVRQSPGLITPVSPYIEFIQTDNTLAEISATGFLNDSVSDFGYYTNNTIALIYVTDAAPVFATIQISGSNINLDVNVGDGDVVGPGSSTANAIATYANNTGKVLINTVAILTPAGDLSGLNLVSGNAFTSDLFITRASGQVSFLNPLGTFSTSWKAGANIANLLYTWPTALPTINGQVFTGNTNGTTAWTTAATGNVVGAGASVTGNFVLYSDTTGRAVVAPAGGAKIVGNSITDVSGITSTGGIIASIFQSTLPGFPGIIMRNAANTFNTGLMSGPVLADTVFTLPVLPVSNGMVLACTTAGVMSFVANGNGDVVGPASAVDGEICLFSGTTGKIIFGNGPRIVSGDLLDINNITSGGSISALTFSTAASGTIGLKNPANTFYTFLQSGAVLSNQSYTFPAALPAVTGYVLSATTAGVMSWIAAPSAIPTPIEVTGTSQLMVPYGTYICNNVALVTLTIPAVVPIGAWFKVIGKGAGKWRVRANTGQTISDGSFTGAAAGRTDATQFGDCATFDCITADTAFRVSSAQSVNLDTV